MRDYLTFTCESVDLQDTQERIAFWAGKLSEMKLPPNRKADILDIIVHTDIKDKYVEFQRELSETFFISNLLLIWEEYEQIILHLPLYKITIDPKDTVHDTALRNIYSRQKTYLNAESVRNENNAILI